LYILTADEQPATIKRLHQAGCENVIHHLRGDIEVKSILENIKKQTEEFEIAQKNKPNKKSIWSREVPM
jgi:hypothetical protein